MNVCKEGGLVERVASTLNQDLYYSWNFLVNSWNINICTTHVFRKHSCRHSRGFVQSGLSKVAGCQQKSLPTWLVIWPATLLGISLWMRFLNKISLDWPLTLTTQQSTSKLSPNTVSINISSFF